MKYELLKEIGRGGLSSVYLAMDKNLNKQWAIKAVDVGEKSRKDEAALMSILAEAELMKKLDWPAFPRIVDIFNEQERLFIVMDYIEGETLERVLRESKGLSGEQILDWAVQLCKALGYLHSLSPPVIYRDLKPSNIMITPDGMVKIIDFGTAKELKEGRASVNMGTVGFASPEQIKGASDVRSDIYSFGRTLEVMARAAPPSEILNVIIARCTCADPSDRYADTDELLYDLEHPETLTQEHAKQVKRKLLRFRALLATGIALLMISATLFAGFFSAKNRDYESLISISESSSVKERIDSYERAVHIYPERPEAYLKMIGAFEEEGAFGEKESSRFLSLYDTYKDRITDRKELCRRAGLLYFNFYSEGGTASRIRRAYPFFAEEPDDIFYLICRFYKDFIFDSLIMDEASFETYEKLLEDIEKSLKNAESKNAYEQITLYNAVFLLLHDQWKEMSDAGIKIEIIGEILSGIFEKAKNLSVSKSRSVKLKEEILENYDAYRREMLCREGY